MLVDRYSNWPIVTRSTNGAEGLCRVLRDTFATYGIPETLTSDGGPEFASHTTRDFLSSWSVFHRTSSAYNPHANCRAETAVKTTKRLIAGNTGPGSTLSDDFHQALLQYRHGPSPGTGMSPAQCLFGRATRDILPGLPATYHPHQDWTSRLDLCERALSRRQATGRARWDEHTQGLANFFFGRGFNLEIFLNLQGSEFIQTLLLIYNHLAKFVVYKSWTRSALLKGTSRCFLVSSITCRSKEAIEWVWSFFVVKLSTKPHPLLVLCFHRQ